MKIKRVQKILHRACVHGALGEENPRRSRRRELGSRRLFQGTIKEI
jgi:hypothetical protein